MADDITSNVIIQTKVPDPKGDGLKLILASLKELQAEMDRIAAKTIEINIRANIDTTGLKELLNSSKATANEINNAVGQAVSASVAKEKAELKSLAGELQVIQRSVTRGASGNVKGFGVVARNSDGLTTKLTLDKDEVLKTQVDTQKDLLALEALKNEQNQKALDLRRRELDEIKKVAAAERERLKQAGFERVGGTTRATPIGTNKKGETVLDLVSSDVFQKVENGTRRTAVVNEGGKTGGIATESDKAITAKQTAQERKNLADIARLNAIDAKLALNRRLAEDNQAKRVSEGFQQTGSQDIFGRIGGELATGEKRILTKPVFKDDGSLDKTRSLQIEINTLTGQESAIRTVINEKEREAQRLLEQNAARQAKANDNAKAALDRLDSKINTNKQLAQTRQEAREAQGFTFDPNKTREVAGKINGQLAVGEVRVGTRQVFNDDGTLDKTRREQIEINTLTGAESRIKILINKQAKETLQAERERASQLKASLEAQQAASGINDKKKFFESIGFKEAVSGGGTRKIQINPDGTEEQIGQKTKLTKALNDTQLAVVELDTATAKYSVTVVQNTAAIKAAESAQRKLDAANSASTHKTNALADGFTQLDSKVKTLADGSIQTIARFSQTTGNAFSGYTVRIREVSDATGDMKENILRGAAALRFIGDSFVSAAAKVTLWISATSAVFGAIAAFKAALSAVKDLEAGTVLLARVGANLTGAVGSDFKERLSSAQRLTAAIVDQSSILGINAVESQKAAAIFLRGQQTEQQALSSTTAAMLAARIAELGVVEAAELLSSAQAQFGINGTQTLSLLDQLNALSNRYRVTTDGLLQSISRSGSVFAEQGGRLSELAAITAVVSNVTSRSGAEIGNALKTVESRLVSIDIQNQVFEKGGIAISNEAGEVKSLSKVVLELQTAFGGLTEIEQNALSTTIAGVRQRNLLVAAINNAAEVTIAEANSLRDSNSARTEAKESNDTLAVALGRVQGSFIQLAQSMSGSGLLALRKIIDAISGLLTIMAKLNNATGNIVPTLAIMLVSFKVLGFAVNKLGLETYITSAAMAVMNHSAQAAEVGLFNVGKSSAVAATEVKVLSEAEIEAAAASRTLQASLGLIAVGLTILVSLLAYYSSAQVEANEASANAVDLNSRLADEAVKRALASRIVTEALIQESDALRERNEQLAKGPDKGNNEETDKKIKLDLLKDKARIESDIDKLLANLNIQSSGKAQEQIEEDIGKAIDLQIGEAKAALDAAQTSNETGVGTALAKARDFTEKEIAELAKSGLKKFVEVNKGRVRGLQIEKNASELDPETFRNLLEEKQKGTPLSQKFLEAQGLSPDLAKKVLAVTNEFADAIKHGASEIEKAEKALENSLKLKPAQQSNFRELVKRVGETRKSFETFQKQQPIQRDIGGAIGLPVIGLIQKDLAGAEANLKDFESELLELQRLGLANTDEKGYFQLLKKDAEDAGLAVEKFRFELRKAQLEEIKSGFSQRQAGLSDLGIGFAEQQLRINRSDRRAPEATGEIERLRVRNNEIKKQISTIADQQQIAGNTDEDIAKSAIDRALAEKLIVELKKNEIDQALALKKLEADIAVEKKKQTDEAAKAIGLLSTEDKIRALAQAQDFARNPNKRVSFDEQFLGDSKDIGLGRSLFGNRFENGFGVGNPNQLLHPDSELGKLFTGAGAGISADLQRSIDAEKVLRGGKDDATIFNDARANVDILEAIRLGMQGIASSPTNNGPVGALAGVTDINLNVQPINLEGQFDELMETFRDVTGAEINNAVENVNREINRIWSTLRSLPGRKLPQTGEGGGPTAF